MKVEEYVLRDATEHLWDSTVFTVYYEEAKLGDDYVSTDLFFEQNVVMCGFWKRLLNCFRYLFKQRKFWNYGETYLLIDREEDRDKVYGLIRFLQKALKRAEANEKKYIAKREK